MLTVSEAVSAVLAHVGPGVVERVPLEDCLGRVLAADVFVTQDSPPFDKSLMDGFAVRSGDFSALSSADDDSPAGPAVVSLPVSATVTAGAAEATRLAPGTAVRIMTGAPVPEGADCVVPIEKTLFRESEPGTVGILGTDVVPEACLMRRGGVAREGSLLMPHGTQLAAQQLAALAEFGITPVSVYRRPEVAVLATGDELVGAGEKPSAGQIRNSNEAMLVAQVRQTGAVPVPLGIARDSVAELEPVIRRGLKADILLLTGGVSAGMLDLVPGQLRVCGVEKIFHGVQMKPGKPLWFGVYEGPTGRCLVFGLPGNPVSSMVCFELFVRAAVRSMMGRRNPGPWPHRGMLTEGIVVRGERPVYHPVRSQLKDGRLDIAVVPWSGSSDLRATVEANSMALLLPEESPYNAGDVVDVYLWSSEALE